MIPPYTTRTKSKPNNKCAPFRNPTSPKPQSRYTTPLLADASKPKRQKKEENDRVGVGGKWEPSENQIPFGFNRRQVVLVVRHAAKGGCVGVGGYSEVVGGAGTSGRGSASAFHSSLDWFRVREGNITDDGGLNRSSRVQFTGIIWNCDSLKWEGWGDLHFD
uniref:Uncharacterized protein n=1 Tax=Strigamia maritima TaxID=126957 RepID=T1J000_STRMM